MGQANAHRIRVNSLGPGDKKRELQAWWKDMMPAVGRAVLRSFREANMANPTMDEQRRRVDLAVRIANELREEFKWGKTRIADTLPSLLRAKLIGLKVNPETWSKRAMWVSEDDPARAVS